MDKLLEAICQSNDLEHMINTVLESLLDSFECDRGFLLYPCDPNTETFRISMEKTRPEWPGAFELGVEFQIDSVTRSMFEALLEGRRCLADDLPPQVREAFSIRSQAEVVVRPRLHKPWMLGIQRCSSERPFSEPELLRLEKMAKLLENLLSAMLAERALAESERRFHYTVDHSPDAVMLFDPNIMEAIFVNPQAQRLFGYSEEELKRLAPWDYSPTNQPDGRNSKEAAIEILQSCLSGDSPHFEWVHLDNQGTEILTEIHMLALQYDDQVVIRANITDIRERKLLESKLRQSQKLEGIGRLAGGIAHDFNNILVVILGYSELLLEDQVSPEDLQEGVVAIRDAAEKAAELTRQLLAFGRKQVLKPKVTDLREVVKELVPMLQRLVDAKISFDLRFAPEPVWASVDRGQIHQVIMNLVTNARDSMRSLSHGRLTIEVATRWQESSELGRGEYSVIKVSDIGDGIPSDVLGQIFEPFFTTKAQGEGTGLGLATVYGIVRQSSGDILVTSLKTGTTFTVCFPISDPVKPGGLEPKLAGDFGGTETILFVEDNPHVAKLGIRALSQLGYTVLAATNGLEALEVVDKLQGQRPDLLVTDVVMPLMGGIPLAKELKLRFADLPMLFVSGYPERTGSPDNWLPEDSHFIQKPFTPSELAQKVREVLNEASPKQIRS